MWCLLGKSPWKHHHTQATILVKPMALGFLAYTFVNTIRHNHFFMAIFFMTKKNPS
jgi:hypothetical protein